MCYCTTNSWLRRALRHERVSYIPKKTAESRISYNVFFLRGINEAGPTAFQNIGYKYYFVFMACSFITFILVFMYCPEVRDFFFVHSFS
jgi:hypothetical protein